jgi:hypothetical protein
MCVEIVVTGAAEDGEAFNQRRPVGTRERAVEEQHQIDSVTAVDLNSAYTVT